MSNVTRILGALAGLSLASCEAIEGAYVPCAEGVVLQAEACPNTGGRLALCTGWSEEAQDHVRVSWCSLDVTPPEGGVIVAECVPECPL